VESDWSAASYWYEIIALAGGNSSVELLGLTSDSMQGDAKVAGLFEKTGIQTQFNSTGIALASVIANGEKQSIGYDFVNEPDLAQTYAVTCCLLDIPFRFTGLQSLRIKETDRMAALQTEMRKLGYLIRNEDTSMEWAGERCEPQPQPVISTYEDHRMAMAFAPACLRGKAIWIKDPEVVTKSYPAYWQDLSRAGFSITKEK
jgi:3-phosphoshikimate 1-carboxyvinyltransferase